MGSLLRKESSQWHDTYRSDVLARRRLATHGKKLERLGVLQSSRDSRILDVGCGEGEMLEILAQRSFDHLYGVDLVSTKDWLQAVSGKPWKYSAASAGHLPFREFSMDWILCAHSLHHLWPIENIATFLSSAKYCLKEKGRLALVDHYDSPQFRLALSLILSPLAELTPLTREMRKQHLEEKENIWGYVRDWRSVKGAIENSGLKTVTFQKGLFFFYWVLQK